jgi:hypothetical protein
MFIGTAPASMGGGITTGTLIVLALAMWSYARGLRSVQVRNGRFQRMRCGGCGGAGGRAAGAARGDVADFAGASRAAGRCRI